MTRDPLRDRPELQTGHLLSDVYVCVCVCVCRYTHRHTQNEERRPRLMTPRKRQTFLSRDG